MLRPSRMKKLQILALEERRSEIVKRLQELGTVHLVDFSEKLGDPAWRDLLRPHPLSSNLRKLAAQNITMNRFLDLFERHDPEPRESFIRSVFAPLPSPKLETRELYGKALIDAADEITERIERETEGPVKELEQIEEEIVEAERAKGLLSLISPLEVDLTDVGESDFLSISLGIVPREEVESVREKTKELTEGCFHLAAQEASENRVLTVLVCLKEHASMVVTHLRRLGWERIEIEGQQGRPGEAIGAITERLVALSQEKARKEAIIVDIAQRWRDELKKHRELLLFERQREETHNKFATMENIVAIEGWVPQRSAARATQEIEEVSRGACVVEVSDPEEADSVPVQLSNPTFIKSFEVLTRLYGLPTYNGVDPTLFLVPGFLLFFSIMLTDALYGVIALALGLLLMRGGGRYNQAIRDGGIILSSAGAATIIIGALSGGWFGDFGLKIPVLAALQVFDPMVQVTTFLLIALGVGLLHVNTGVVIHVVHNLKRGQKRKAVTENLWFLFVQPGLLFLVGGHKPLGFMFLAISLVLLLVGHKAMAMFQVTGFMGDVLSYARLMALGLCTTGIAMTVNVLSGMLYMLGSAGVIFAATMFLLGHLFNFVINAMGSFVHGLRLHYVEFFTKFYESGGTEFSPLKMMFDKIEIK